MSTGLAACGWLRGTSRTSPGPPRRWRRPVWLRSTSARGRGFAAYLSGCARQLLNVRCAHYAGGASLTTFGFVTIVPRYLLPQVIPSHAFAALAALVVRRGNGIAALVVRRGNGIAALVVCRVRVMLTGNGLAPARLPEGHWRAYPAATPCRRTYARTSEIPVFPPKTNCILQSPVYINNSIVTGRNPANSVNRKISKSL